MKLLIFSDSHKRLKNATNVLKKLEDRIDAVIHLGDVVSDALRLQALFNKLPFHIVAGNCDPKSDIDRELILTIYDVNILITHGHTYGVKRNITSLSYAASEKNATVALFGHTHRSIITQLGDVTLLNPGSIAVPRDGGNPSYGVLEITPDGSIYPAIIKL